MACLHKFHANLLLKNLGFEPTTLIVGTFNPGWDNLGNNATWFYGRTHDAHGNQNNNFWDVLPRLYNEKSLINGNKKDWKSFCSEKKIAITDLLSSIDDADEENVDHRNILRSYSDKELAIRFNHHIPVDFSKILAAKPSIENVYLTRSDSGRLWGRLWTPVKRSCNEKINCCNLLTPSSYARIQHGKYNKHSPNQRIPNLADYILMRWRTKWHQIN